jgi:hypothetical protein
MMLQQRFLALLLAVALPTAFTASARGTAAATDLTGHWEAPVMGDGLTFTFMFDFVAKGDTLTGTVELSTQDRTFPITDGKIDRNKVSFKGFGLWTGELVGNELRLTRGLDYGKTQEMVARRK